VRVVFVAAPGRALCAKVLPPTGRGHRRRHDHVGTSPALCHLFAIPDAPPFFKTPPSCAAPRLIPHFPSMYYSLLFPANHVTPQRHLSHHTPSYVAITTCSTGAPNLIFPFTNCFVVYRHISVIGLFVCITIVLLYPFHESSACFHPAPRVSKLYAMNRWSQIHCDGPVRAQVPPTVWVDASSPVRQHLMGYIEEAVVHSVYQHPRWGRRPRDAF
jgi:hypothetical protein